MATVREQLRQRQRGVPSAVLEGGLVRERTKERAEGDVGTGHKALDHLLVPGHHDLRGAHRRHGVIRLLRRGHGGGHAASKHK